MNLAQTSLLKSFSFTRHTSLQLPGIKHIRQNVSHRAANVSDASTSTSSIADQQWREGAYEAPLVQQQADKTDPEQPSLASALEPYDPTQTADIAVVGCGPAGLALAAELASRGLSVALLGLDVPFVNNYGVWLDEFKTLGLEHTLDFVWENTLCMFKEGQEVPIDRAYGRVCRRRLRAHLLDKCKAANVKFLAGEVSTINTNPSATSGQVGATLKLIPEGSTDAKTTINARMVTLTSGAAAGQFLKYEENAPGVAAQTAYGIEAEVEGYDTVYDPTAMLFMDYRRHHTGVAMGLNKLAQKKAKMLSAEVLWGSETETPSFLYAMPLGGNRVFLEETCLVAKPALPFAVLKRRLERRCAVLGIKIKDIHEEEWSYIPTGGPLPVPDQALTAFGAAANLIHPATGYSIARSLKEAPGMATAIQTALNNSNNTAADAASYVWEALWNQEKRRQAAFHVFGMELLCKLDVGNTSDFFTTFFALPNKYWRGFLASSLSSMDLITFALFTFALAPINIKAKLVSHLINDPAGKYLVSVYTAGNTTTTTDA